METENHTDTSADKPIGPGTRLNDIFEIDEKIATGGMGEVFRGHNITTDEAVAIKIVLGEFARDEKYSNLFFKEARVLSSLNHPSIVRYQIFTIDKTIGRPYLVMEYIDGMSLAERLGRGPLSVEEVRRLTARLADGLETAHAAGVVHRDLSPDNILLSNNDVALPKLIDFGIARTTRAGQKTFLSGEFAGRTNFASPEQFGLFGGNVEAASDVYSLGLVVINALQGAALDMNGTQYEMIEKRRRVPDLSHLDADLRPIIEEMLVPDPAARHLTMADVANYFSGRTPLENLKRSAEPAADDAEDFWLSPPAETASSASPPEPQPANPNATIIAASRDDAAAGPEPEKPQPVPAGETIIAGAPIPPQPEAEPPFEPLAVEAKPIIWESQPVAAVRPVAALPVRKRRAWPFALAAAVLVLAAGGAGAFYSGALKNVLPPELDALLRGKFTTGKTEQVAQDDLPQLTAQPDRPVKTTNHVTAEKPVKTNTQIETTTTKVTENTTVKQKTGTPVDATVTRPDNAKVAENSAVDEAKPKKDKDETRLEVANSTAIKPASDKTGQKQQIQKIEQRNDKPATEIANATTTDTSGSKVTNSDTSLDGKPGIDVKRAEEQPVVQHTEVKPAVVVADQPHSADTAKNTADVSTLPKDSAGHDETLPRTEETVTHGHETEVAATVQKTETAPDSHKADMTADKQNEDSAIEPGKDDDSLGGILPDENRNTAAQDKQPTDNTHEITNDTSVEPKNDNLPAHDTNTSAEVTKHLSTDASKQAPDKTAGRTELPAVQQAEKDDGKLGQEESLSTAVKPAVTDKTDGTTHVDHLASDVTGKPASTISHEESVATTGDHAGKNTAAETHVATTVTTPAKTTDTENETNDNIGLPGDVLPSENDVKHTPSDATSDNTGETVHDDVKPADTATTTARPETNQSVDTVANENKTGQQADLTDNSGETVNTETKPSVARTDNSEQPASVDNSDVTAKTDDVQQTGQVTNKTDQTTDTETTPSDTAADSGLPADNKGHVDEGKDNPVDTAEADNGGQSNKPVKDQATEGKLDEGDSTLPANATDDSKTRPADQAQSTDVAVGEPTTEIKHPEIAVDEGLAKRESWVTGFEAGDCFYARMTTNVASAAGIVAVAADSQPFFALNDSFTSTFGLEPALRGVPIDRRQCAITPLLKGLRQAPNEALDLKLLPADEVVSGKPLSSHVGGVTKPVRTIYLIDNDGRVYDLSKDVRNKTGPDVEFDYTGKEAKSNAKTFKILLLIGSDKPLAVDFPRKPPAAKNIIPEIAKAINLQPGGIQYAYGFFKVVPKAD